MTIRVPVRLRREPGNLAALALYVPSRDPADLLAVCAGLNLDPTGRVFAVEDGFLLTLERPATAAVPGATRLRKLTEGLYLPVDAVLVPALLADEAAGVVRDRGLVFLHGGRVLEFDREAPIDPKALLAAGRLARGPWCSLPEPETQAERLNQIVLEVPEPDPDEIYREIRKDMNRGKKRPGLSQRDESGKTKGGEDRDGAEGEERGSETDDTAEAGSVADLQATGGSDSLRETTVRGILRPLGEAISAMREKIQWDWVDHSALVKKLVREFREGDKAHGA